MTLRDALDRTLLLMRDEVGEEVNDSVLLAALTGTRVAIIADEMNLATHAAQTAFITAAILMARSGHSVFLLAPDAPLIGPQPPLQPGRMVEQLLRVGKDMLPGVEFVAGDPAEEVDLAIALGDSAIKVRARRRIRLNAEPWAGVIAREDHMQRWNTPWWPFGALAAAAIAAGEAFKIAMRKLLPVALNPAGTAAVFADTDELTFSLAPADTPYCRDLGNLDFVSGGAIVNAALYALARIPAVNGRGRIIEPDTSAISNLNRYMLLLRSQLEGSKARDLAELLGNGLRFEPIDQLYEPELLKTIAPLAPTVVVGVDDIPTRWVVQQAKPEWLVIGATTHWSAMASFHREGLGCAQCLHPEDDPGVAPIPTTACVSFWAGLLAATYFARHTIGQTISIKQQQTFLTPFRPENPFRTAVHVRKNCPTCQVASASSPVARWRR
jgi:hypothetical protein